MKNIETTNLKPLILNKISELVKDNPELSIIEIFYTILRFTPKPDNAKTGWMINPTEGEEMISDRDIYTALNKAIYE